MVFSLLSSHSIHTPYTRESTRFTPNLIYSCRSSTVHQWLFVAPFLPSTLLNNILSYSLLVSIVWSCGFLRASSLSHLLQLPPLYTTNCLITRSPLFEPCGRQRCSLRLGFLLSSSSFACLSSTLLIILLLLWFIYTKSSSHHVRCPIPAVIDAGLCDQYG